MEIFAVILSTLGTICICITPILKGKNMRAILLLLFLANLLVATSYALTAELNGAVSCGVGAIQTIINYFFERKNKPIPLWLIAIYAAAFTVVNLLVLTHITGIIALLACLVSVVGISQKSGKRFRLWTLLNTTLWIAYDLITLSFGPLSTHTIQTATILIGILIHDRKRISYHKTAE